MKQIFVTLMILLASLAAYATPHIVEGKIDHVVGSEKEIYVISQDDGKKYEYYFTTKTNVSKNGETGSFSDLKKGLNVKVTANKVGKRLDPVHVEILE